MGKFKESAQKFWEKFSKVEPSKANDFDMGKADMISGIVVSAFGLWALVSGLDMIFFKTTGAVAWYASPGISPAFIGGVLVILGFILFFGRYKEGVRLNKPNIKEAKLIISNNSVVRLFVAVALLALYVFVLVGLIPFVLATFIYLLVTMIVFRTDDFAIWKLAIISAVVSVLIYVLFGIVAAIPLP